jgi:eukaryotic-like serine/threonine-protein kinase
MDHCASLASARDEIEGSAPMTAEEWKRVKDVLATALEREPSERLEYLDQNCPDPYLRKEVESLLSSCEEGDSHFLEHSDFEHSVLECGVILGSYKIVSRLGSGGMGEVYRAYDTKLGREVALKVLPADFADDPTSLTRFRREAHVLASLNHPNIVTIYDVDQDGRTVYIAMELVDGKPLDDVLATGPMPLGEMLDVAAQIGAGLAVAHNSRIVHRDLKPQNVMIRKDRLVKILDFGLSKRSALSLPDSDKLSVVTVPGIILGTIDYMSPEQASGQPADFRSDQFSFGSLVYEMATRQRPFRRRTGAETLAAIIGDEPTPVTHLIPQLPVALGAVIQRCMAKEPEKRYASTEELAHELKELRESGASREVKSRSARAKAGMLRRAFPLRVRAILATVVLVAAIGIAAPRFAGKIRAWSHSVSPATEKELVVLPFTNVGNDPGSQAFCDGLVEILSSKLSQLEQFQKALRVVPATDVLREGIVTVKEARQIFGVTLAITGSIQRTDNRVRMTINLVDPQTLRQLKSKTIDTEVHDIAALQDGVVLEAADLLDIRLTSEAKQVLTSGGTTVPDAYDLYAEGRGYLQRYDVPQNVDNAISLFKLALERDNRYALAEAGLGEAYWQKYEHTKDSQWAEEAKKTSAAAIALNNKLPQVYVALGMIHTGMGDYDQAIGNLQKALALDPYDGDAYRELAKAYEKRGRLQEAESTYRNAVAARPNYWGAHNELGGFYYRQGRYDEAEKEFRTVVELTPDNARGYSNLGVIAHSQKRYEDAAKMFEKSVAIKPSDKAYSNLGGLYYSLGRYSDAAFNFQKAVEMNDRDSMLWHNLASAYKESNEPEKARVAFDRTAKLAVEQLRVNPRDPDVLIRLADAYSMLEQPQRARGLLERALALAPESVDDMFQAGEIYEQLQDRKHALEWIGKAIKSGYSRDLVEKSPDLAQLRLDPKFQSLLGP